MATYIKNHYDIKDKTFKRFEELMPEHVTINKWYPIGTNSFIYYNEKGYYHMATLKKSITHYYFNDYVLNGKMELVFSKEIGYFKNMDEAKEYLQEVM